jgi:hypothetical protein
MVYTLLHCVDLSNSYIIEHPAFESWPVIVYAFYSVAGALLQIICGAQSLPVSPL